MKRLAFALILLTSASFAQEATLSTPEAGITATKAIVQNFAVQRDCACAWVEVGYLSAENAEKRKHRFDIPTADLGAFLTAIGSPRSGETGVPGRRMNFRILGYLVDSGRLSATLVP